MWLGLQAVSSLERCPLFRVSFIERFHWTSCTHVSRRLSLPTSPHHPFMHITPPFAAGQDSYLHITLLTYVRKCIFCQLHYFNNHASITSLTWNALTTPVPISTNTDFRQIGHYRSASCKALLLWILQVVTQEWSEWSCTLRSKFSVKMTYLCLNWLIGCVRAPDIVWYGWEGSRTFTTWTHRAVTT